MNAGHAHADLLSLTASAGGRHLLVDPGTFSYPGPERNAFRGGGAHNTVLVNGAGTSVPAEGAFQWEATADGRPLAWEAGEALVHFEGTHDGFAALAAGVSHRRAVLLIPGLGWVVRDRVEAAVEHVVRAHWHLAPGLAPAAGTRVVDADGSAVLTLAAFAHGRPAALRAEAAWVSPRYGARVASTRLVCEERLPAGAHDLVFLVLPTRGTGAPTPAGDAVAALTGLRVGASDGVRRTIDEVLAAVGEAAGRAAAGAESAAATPGASAV
jgi:hypothetical protein